MTLLPGSNEEPTRPSRPAPAPLSPEETTLLSRIQSPATLAEYASEGQWLPYRHLTYISNQLVKAVTSKEQEFLSIQASVRHGKSEIVSKWFIVWYLGLFPEKRVLIVSYNEDFAKKWTRSTRDLYAEWGPKLFGQRVREDIATAVEWETTAGGGVKAAGAGGSITGLGFDLIVIDDPIKNIEEALSTTGMEKMREWYDTTVRTRLRSKSETSDGGTMILTMARWTDFDLAAYVLGDVEQAERPYPDAWKVIRLPALAEAPKGVDVETWRDEIGRAEGEPLWPEQWPLEALRPMIGTSAWDSLYQQSPVPRGGGMFKTDDWQRRAVPDHSGWRKIRFWDTAATKGKGDWTVGVLMGMDPDGFPWVLDVIRKRVNSAGVEDLLTQTAGNVDTRTVPIRYEEAKAAAGKATTNAYARLLIGYDFRGIPVEGDKEMRAALMASAQQNNLIRVVEAHWTDDFIEECSRFPNGRHDDQVDAASGAFKELTGGGPCEIIRPSEVITMDPIDIIKAEARARSLTG